MEQQRPSNTDSVIEQLRSNRFIRDSTTPERQEQKESIIKNCKKVLETQRDPNMDQSELVIWTLEFIKSLWNKYDCIEVAQKYDKYVKMEEALFGLEREEETGGRYRDHFVHMFNTFLFGLRFFAELCNRLDEKSVKKILKIDCEDFKGTTLASRFTTEYKHTERVFYLWMLIATFHDIAIPFEHMERIGEGIGKFVGEFRWVFAGPSVSIRSFDSSQLHNYFSLLSRIYDGGLVLEEDGLHYHKTEKPHYYLLKLLGRAFDDTNHGVLSGLFMWKTIEEIFLLKLSKYKFTPEEFNAYTELILEQDIARAALAISLHNLKPETLDKSPGIYPLDFRGYPLAFLLILADELQEYHRREGTSIRSSERFTCQPALVLHTNNLSPISLKVIFTLDSDQEAHFLRGAKSTNNVEDAMKEMFAPVSEALSKKLLLGEDFKLEVSVCRAQNTDSPIYSKKIIRERDNE